MKIVVACGVGLVLALAVPGHGVAQEPVVGSVKVVEGAAFVERGGRAVPARVGQKVYRADGLQTGADGAMGVILRDDSRLSLGPDSEVRIDQFAFVPTEGKLALVIKMLRGVAAYISGKIAKLSPDSVEVETPVAIVGIRGTRFAVKLEGQ